MSETASVDDWTEPGVFEVATGVHRIPLPLPNDGLRAVNVYALSDSDGVVLVDSGWSLPVARALLEAALRALDCSLADIHRFLITHVHRDHYTQAVSVRRDHGTAIGLGAGERLSLDAIRRPGRHGLEQQLQELEALGGVELVDTMASLVRNGDQPPDLTDWEYPDEWLLPGPLTLQGGRMLDVVETPGHTRGHVVFHDAAAGLLFAGDHVLPRITPSIGFEPVKTANPLGAFLASLALVRRMPDAVLLPAHGAVTHSVHARIDELVMHHGRRLDETEAAVGLGATTGFEVAGQLRWTRRLHALSDLDPFNQMLAVAETGAHLELLCAQGRLMSHLDGSVNRYTQL